MNIVYASEDGDPKAVQALLEREPELAAIDGLLAAHGALVVGGQAGLGKTRLVEEAVGRARERDLLVVRAVASELEREFAFGVAGQLLHNLLTAVPRTERGALLGDAPARIRALYRDGPRLQPAEPQEGLAVSHGLFSVLAAATEARSVLVAIDDLHWADAPSLEFVVYLLHRLSELPVALFLTHRPGAELDAIVDHSAVRRLTLTPLGPEAVAELVTRELGEAGDERLRAACLDATGGNPFYLHELLLALAEESTAGEELAQQARGLVPDAVARTLRRRIARLGPAAAELARAVAILGDEVPLRRAAALAGLDPRAAGAAADALASVEVLAASEPLGFVHPLVRTAVADGTPTFERAARHLDAARLLAREGSDAQHVAAHLLRGTAAGDPWVVQQLRDAAREARAQGAATSATHYLERALAEPPPPELRADVLAELGAAEAEVGSPAADEHLVQALAATTDPLQQAEIALLRGGALHARGLPEPAAMAFKEGLARLDELGVDPGELRDRLLSGLLLSSAVVPSLQGDAMRTSAEVLAGNRRETAGRRLVLAQATVEAAFSCRPAAEVVELASQAWDDGRLLEDATTHGASWVLVTGAFCLAGDLERSLAAAEAAAADARERSAPLAFATATVLRAQPELWRGDVDAALADLELARDARRYGWQQYARSAAALYACCLIEKGELERAADAIVEDPPLTEPYDAEDAVRLLALAELQRAQERYAEAYETALAAGATAEAGFPYLGYCPWRGSAAQSALALGRLEDAREHVRHELERTETTGVRHERIRALRLAGLCEQGDAGLVRLREAVELGEAGPPRLETIHALVALGSALRRAKKRAEARAPLERALELARRGGAVALQERARTELLAVGARPRRDALSGPDSLTPSERRVAELAAAGHVNREIARLLFVTPKTVEFHLRNTYRKLEIQTRRELGDALEI